MKLSNRSYPHPVVGNADDVPKAAFQASLEYHSDKQYYFIDVAVVCSSASIVRHIERNAAAYVLHVECGNTLFRQAFDFCEDNKRIAIPATKLNGTVEVNCFIRATKDIERYRVDGSHEDYGKTSFDVRAGDVLGIAEGQTFEAEPKDTLRRIGSIMVIEESPKSDDHAMEVQFSTDKIRIVLSKTDFATYKELKPNPALASHLTTTIVLPVLTEALHVVKTSSSEFDELKWFKNLKGRLEDLGPYSGDDLLKAAQLILDMPIRRALTSAKGYVTGSA